MSDGLLRSPSEQLRRAGIPRHDLAGQAVTDERIATRLHCIEPTVHRPDRARLDLAHDDAFGRAECQFRHRLSARVLTSVLSWSSTATGRM